MREEDALRTVDCLRGRLQAERAASRDAADNVDLLTNKLQELEKQLKIEIKSRKRKEKKLKLLKKKLESLNITKITEECCEQSQSSSSNNSDEISCMSSISSSSYYNQNHQQQQQEEGYQKIPETEGSKCSSSSITGEIESEIVVVNNYGQNSEENCHGSKHIMAEEKGHENVSLENQDDRRVDDSMALVLVSSIVEPKPLVGPRELEDRNVVEVLDTLKQIRENLQSSLDIRSIIKVG